jgi:sec-independent protein translocase protein TatB
MFDFSWGEVLVIGGVALIVIGPKDLPKALRTVGQMTSKVRRMAGEFQAQFNEAMREAELDEVRKDLQGLNTSVAAATSTAFNPIQTIRDEIKGAIDKPAEPETASHEAAAAVPPDFESGFDLPALPPVPPVTEGAATVTAPEPVNVPEALPATAPEGTPGPQR